MKGILIIYLSVFISISYAQTPEFKLITPGEHLGYLLESFNSNQPLNTNIKQGENWLAIYIDGDKFMARKEVLSWNSLENFTIKSNSEKQPLFYVQGLKSVNGEGPCKTFIQTINNYQELPIWNFNNSNYFISYTDDSLNKKLSLQKYGAIESDRKMTVYQGVNEKTVKSIKFEYENIVNLIWTGDLNGDQEPDFLIAVNSHHEEIKLEFILSKKINSNTIWERVARFTEWS